MIGSLSLIGGSHSSDRLSRPRASEHVIREVILIKDYKDIYLKRRKRCTDKYNVYNEYHNMISIVL